jgi:5-formyltetrahydrofolate cyclo-ligase
LVQPKPFTVTGGNPPREDRAAQKNTLRRTISATRKSRSDGERSAAARANIEHLNALLAGSAVVCGYLPLASEPLSGELLDRLAAGGTTVLVPVVRADSPLDWCRYPGPTVPGSFGIAEPSGPRLGPDAARSADAILVPAFAVDRLGRRLGRGGGHYDRTLALLSDEAALSATGAQQLIAVLFDGEVIDMVPAEQHDKPVTAAVTPTVGIVRFPSSEPTHLHHRT